MIGARDGAFFCFLNPIFNKKLGTLKMPNKVFMAKLAIRLLFKL